MSYRRFAACVLVGVVGALAIGSGFYARPWESEVTRAYRLCEACGLGACEVDELVNSTRHSTLKREQRAELFYATYKTPAEAGRAREPGGGCVEAVLDAAGK